MKQFAIVPFVIVFIPACASEPNPVVSTTPAAMGSALATTPAHSSAIEAAGTKEKLPLSTYLSRAASASISAVTSNPSGAGFRTELIRALDEVSTKEFLGKVDLTQRADGRLVRCPNDTVVEFRDAGGTLLGTIGFCKDAARFDAPDGSFGGIEATRP